MLPDWLALAGELEVEVTHDTHLDLGTTPDDDRTLLAPTLSLLTIVKPSEYVQGVLLLEFSSEILLEAAPAEEAETAVSVLELTEAFLQFDNLFGSLWSLQIGRQTFEDTRQWIFDAELDAVRVLYRSVHFLFDMAIAWQGLLVHDLLTGTRETSANYYWLYGQYYVRRDITLAAYSLLHTDHNPDVRLFFLGLRSYGDLTPELSYWFDVAHVRGKEEARTVRGWGLDVGVLYALEHLSLEPSLMVGVAFGSGDATPEGTRDTAFRQTGLQGNAAEFKNVVDVQYYGELLDPELSNLLMVTAGVGISPHAHTSLALIYHGYWQHIAASTLREARLTAEPTGRQRHLGHGLDLIGGWASGRLECKVVLGAFWPGPAFAGTDALAFFAQGRIRIEFK
jgi:alginate production protein